ncbi:MAG: HD-GYP domain-containing protein [Fimbriimonadaceae bacterium]
MAILSHHRPPARIDSNARLGTEASRSETASKSDAGPRRGALSIALSEPCRRATEFRDEETGQHTRRVGELSAAIAQALGLQAEIVDTIRLAAPLQDVGKVAVPNSILFKPGKLDNAEIETMRRLWAGVRADNGKEITGMQFQATYR